MGEISWNLGRLTYREMKYDAARDKDYRSLSIGRYLVESASLYRRGDDKRIFSIARDNRREIILTS